VSWKSPTSDPTKMSTPDQPMRQIASRIRWSCFCHQADRSWGGITVLLFVQSPSGHPPERGGRPACLSLGSLRQSETGTTNCTKSRTCDLRKKRIGSGSRPTSGRIVTVPNWVGEERPLNQGFPMVEVTGFEPVAPTYKAVCALSRHAYVPLWAVLVEGDRSGHAWPLSSWPWSVRLSVPVGLSSMLPQPWFGATGCSYALYSGPVDASL
jgi:hypothetical protein